MSTIRCKLLALGALAVLVTITPVWGDVDDQIRATMDKAHDMLETAINGKDGVVPNPSERTATLKQVLEMVKNLPPAHYHGRRITAMTDLTNALMAIDQNQPETTIVDDIRQADRAIGSIN